MVDGDVFVLTVRMDSASFSRLDARRQCHFPPERNFLPAHLTLFHTLSDEQRVELERQFPQWKWQPLALEFLPPVLIGQGVAIPVASGELVRRHAVMMEFLGVDAVTRQDRQTLRPHVTVQNKVGSAIAKATLNLIKTDFSAWTGRGVGLDIWRYLGGPWTFHTHLPFLSEASSA